VQRAQSVAAQGQLARGAKPRGERLGDRIDPGQVLGHQVSCTTRVESVLVAS